MSAKVSASQSQTRKLKQVLTHEILLSSLCFKGACEPFGHFALMSSVERVVYDDAGHGFEITLLIHLCKARGAEDLVIFTGGPVLTQAFLHSKLELGMADTVVSQ